MRTALLKLEDLSVSETAQPSPKLRALRDRVTAPSSIALPTAGDGLTWRSATAADIDLILDLARAAGKIDHPRSLVTRDELEEEFGSEVFDPERDAVIAVDTVGRAVAYGSATAPASQETIVWVELHGTVAPDRRREGIGTALLAWQEACGLQHLAASDAALPGWLASSAQDHATPAIRLLEAHGYERARWWLELERDLASPVAAQPPVPGVRLVAYSAEWDERARTAMNDAFRDHWGSQPVTAAEWASGDRLEAFRPDLSLLAVTPTHTRANASSGSSSSTWRRTSGRCAAARSATSQPSAYGGRHGGRGWLAHCWPTYCGRCGPRGSTTPYSTSTPRAPPAPSVCTRASASPSPTARSVSSNASDLPDHDK